MSAQYVSSTFFRSVTSKTGRTIAVDIVDKTTAWVRPSNYPTESVKDKFADAAVRNADAFQPDVESVAMKYVFDCPHGSDFVHVSNNASERGNIQASLTKAIITPLMD